MNDFFYIEYVLRMFLFSNATVRFLIICLQVPALNCRKYKIFDIQREQWRIKTIVDVTNVIIYITKKFQFIVSE